MVKKWLFILSNVLFAAWVCGQEAPSNFVYPEEDWTVAPLKASQPYFFHPTVESILHNPEVYKKELSRNFIQATGYKDQNQKHFEIHFRKEELHGAWQSYYSNQQLCDSGVLERNLPDGEWKTWYPNGKVKTVRTYSAEKYHYIKSDIRRNHPKDQRYSITRLAQRSHRIDHHFQPQYKNMLPNGQSLSLLQKIEHNTVNNGQSYVPPFDRSLHHGRFINYYETGAVKDSGCYRNGLKEGLWKESRDGNATGQTAFGFYKNGLRHGQWKYYAGNGRLLYTEHYKHGVTHARHHFTHRKKS